MWIVIITVLISFTFLGNTGHTEGNANMVEIASSVWYIPYCSAEIMLFVMSENRNTLFKLSQSDWQNFNMRIKISKYDKTIKVKEMIFSVNGKKRKFFHCCGFLLVIRTYNWKLSPPTNIVQHIIYTTEYIGQYLCQSFSFVQKIQISSHIQKLKKDVFHTFESIRSKCFHTFKIWP